MRIERFKNNKGKMSTDESIEKYKYFFTKDYVPKIQKKENEEIQDNKNKKEPDQFLHLGRIVYWLRIILVDENVDLSKDEKKFLSHIHSKIIDLFNEIGEIQQYSQNEMKILNEDKYDDVATYFEHIANKQLEKTFQSRQHIQNKLFSKQIQEAVFYTECEGEKYDLNELSQYKTRIVFIRNVSGEIQAYGPGGDNGEWQLLTLDLVNNECFDEEYPRYSLYCMKCDLGNSEKINKLIQILKNNFLEPCLLIDKYIPNKFYLYAKKNNKVRITEIEDDVENHMQLFLNNLNIDNNNMLEALDEDDAFCTIDGKLIDNKIYNLLKPGKTTQIFLDPIPGLYSHNYRTTSLRKISLLAESIQKLITKLYPLHTSSVYDLNNEKKLEESLLQIISDEAYKDKHLNSFYHLILQEIIRNVIAIDRHNLLVFEKTQYFKNQLFHYSTLYHMASKFDGKHLPLIQSFDPLSGSEGAELMSNSQGRCSGYVCGWATQIVKHLKFSFLTDDVNFEYQQYKHKTEYDIILALECNINFVEELQSNLEENKIYYLALRNSKEHGHAVGIRKIPIKSSKECQVEFFDPNFGLFLFPTINKFNSWFTFFLMYTRNNKIYDYDCCRIRHLSQFGFELGKNSLKTSFLNEFQEIKNHDLLAADALPYIQPFIEDSMKKIALLLQKTPQHLHECGKDDKKAIEKIHIKINKFKKECLDKIMIFVPTMKNKEELHKLKNQILDSTQILNDPRLTEKKDKNNIFGKSITKKISFAEQIENAFSEQIYKISTKQNLYH